MDSLLAIYPTARKVEDWLKRESFGRCLIGHRIITFPQLSDSLWHEIGRAEVIVGPVAERLALEEAISRGQRRGIVVPGARGFRDHLLALIRRLKSAGIDGNELRDACRTEAGTRQLAAFAEVFIEYDRVLREAGAVDQHDRERLTLQALHQMEMSGQRPVFLAGVERLLVAEIYDPGLLQFLTIAALIRIVGDADLTLQAEPHKVTVSRFADLSWNRFVGEESIADKVLPHFVRRGGRAGRLGFVLEHLYEDTETQPPAPDRTVRIIQAPDARHEVEAAARAIREMLEQPANQRLPLERIGIVARDITLYADYLREVFRRYRIPLDLVHRRPLASLPSARMVRDLLQLAGHDYGAGALKGLCNASFSRNRAAIYRGFLAQVGYLDRTTRPLAECVEIQLAALAAELEQTSDQRQADNLRKRTDYLSRASHAWGELIALLEAIERAATISAHVGRLLELLDYLGFEPPGDSLVDPAAASTAPVIAALQGLADAAAIVTPARQLSPGEFAALVDSVLGETVVEGSYGHPGGVRAMPVMEARGLDFELIFILGLNDGCFPARHAQTPLLPDELVRKLNGPLGEAMRCRWGRFAPDAPGPILRTRYQRESEEPFLFFLALSMPRRSVVLAYSAIDHRGKPLAPSPFVGEVLRLLPDTELERLSGNDLIAPLASCFVQDEFLLRAAADSILPEVTNVADAEQRESILRRTALERGRELYFALPTREELVDHRRRGKDFSWLALDLSADPGKFASATAYDGRVAVDEALRRFILRTADGARRPWTATQLSELASCGFKFFARRVLMLREPGEPDYEQSQLEAGGLIHQVLHAIFDQVSASEPSRLATIQHQVLEEFRMRGLLTARDPAFFALQWAAVADTVAEVVEFEVARASREVQPAESYLEQPLDFVLRRRPPAAGGPDEVALRGQPDRLELYREGGAISRLKLVDYKNSRWLKPYARLLSPDYFACADLQIPLYAMGAVECFASEMLPGATVEASYIALKNRDKENEPRVLPREILLGPSRDEPDCHLRTVRERIFELLDAAAAGHFDVDPLECKDYCPYRRVCRYHKRLVRI